MDQLAIIITVFTASLFGSSHCAVMCGPLFYASGKQHYEVILFQAGRLVSYLMLAGIASFLGSVGFRIFLGTNAGLAMTLLTSSYLILCGILQFLPATATDTFKGRFGRAIHSLITNAAIRTKTFKVKGSRSLALGLLTAFLPCGWLYIFVATAILINDVLLSFAILIFLWLGSLPVFGILHLIRSNVFGDFKTYGRFVSGLVLIVLGLLMPFLKLSTQGHAISQSISTDHTFSIEAITQGRAVEIIPDSMCRTQ